MPKTFVIVMKVTDDTLTSDDVVETLTEDYEGLVTYIDVQVYEGDD